MGMFPMGFVFSDNRSSFGERMDNQAIKRHLFTAVHMLGSDEGTVDVRLRKVYDGQLRHLMERLTLPHDIRQDYEQLMTDLARLFAEQSTVDPDRASLLARRVVAFYQQVMDDL